MPNSDLKVLGEKVRKERKLAGLTQEQLAERCHVSTKHISNIQNGNRVKRVQSNLSFLSRSSAGNLNGLDPHTGKAPDRVLQ